MIKILIFFKISLICIMSPCKQQQKYRKVIKLSNQDFKRISGVAKETFKEMIKVIKKYYLQKESKGGRKKSLSANDELLMMLEY